ncbi:hypothetical protein ACFV2X_38435 [Streptomyces sp. NPDC059679]|uniref:hypothetical protein n=1 Tax=Streptomyces sp. NPDC059679 TaxID=3346903 RepID=UPI0036AD8A90
MSGRGGYEPPEEEMRGAPVVPGFELPDSVTLARGVVQADGLQPEDVGVLGFLKLRDPRRPATKEELAREMQALGWKMGKTRFDGIFQRLKATGHIKHAAGYNPETGRPEWRIEFYLNPANNDQYVKSGIAAFPQVNTETPETGDTQHARPFETPETGVSPGQKESRDSRDPGGKPRKPAFPSEPVPAGHNRNAENPVSALSPPHPPEGGGTPPPNPPKTGRAGKWAAACALHPEDYVPTMAEVRAANDFLQDLPGRWQCGPDVARDLAPLLASRAHTQGHELDDFFALELTYDDPKNPARMPVRTLPGRIRDLKRRRTQEDPTPDTTGASGRLAPWCGECNRGEMPVTAAQRMVELTNGRDVPCEKCHPKFTRRATN